MTRAFKLVQLITIAAWLVIFPVAAYAQDNSRATYSWSKPAKTVTFNSITNNPDIGDERDFLRVRPFNDASYVENLKVNNSEEVVLLVYYDNNAATNYNLKSKNTHVRINIPAVSAKTITPTGYVLSDNAKPQVVSDTATFSADNSFSLKYQAGSAQIWNNSLRGAKLPDSVVSQQGTLIGTSKLDGVVPGGPTYSGYVTIRAKVQYATTNASTGSTGVVNTGPGQTALLFVAATVIGALAHRLYAVRKNA